MSVTMRLQEMSVYKPAVQRPRAMTVCVTRLSRRSPGDGWRLCAAAAGPPRLSACLARSTDVPLSCLRRNTTRPSARSRYWGHLPTAMYVIYIVYLRFWRAGSGRLPPSPAGLQQQQRIYCAAVIIVPNSIFSIKRTHTLSSLISYHACLQQTCRYSSVVTFYKALSRSSLLELLQSPIPSLPSFTVCHSVLWSQLGSVCLHPRITVPSRHFRLSAMSSSVTTRGAIFGKMTNRNQTDTN